MAVAVVNLDCTGADGGDDALNCYNPDRQAGIADPSVGFEA